MKKVLAACLLALPSFCFCQMNDFFILTPNGMRAHSDSTKDYIVYNFDGKTKHELFVMVETAIGKLYASPKDVESKVEDESITINGVAANAIMQNKRHLFNLRYSINFQFKDGKIRANAPDIQRMSLFTYQLNLMIIKGRYAKYSIYDRKTNALLEPIAKKSLESFFAKLEMQILFSGNKSNDW